MHIILLTTPAHSIATSPETISRWLATECPNEFELQRKDWIILSSSETVGSPADCMSFTLDAEFTGDPGDAIMVYNNHNDSMVTGHVVNVSNASPDFIVDTDIPYDATFDGAYLNDMTLFNGFYFEGRLTVNDVLQSLTVIASPNSFGIAALDVSGILRIMTALDKNGDYSELIMAETNKSGKFTIEYRAQWYGADNAWIAESNDWYYAECIRSIEQGPNLYPFVPSDAGDAPFLNSFDEPVYFAGFPFDISFINPAFDSGSPESVLRVTLRRYNSANELLAETVTEIAQAAKAGRVCSLNIDPAAIETYCVKMTAQIELI